MTLPLANTAITPPSSSGPLADHLLAAARWHANRFFEDFDLSVNGFKAVQMAWHAGSCVELYAKYLIAKEHPLLVFQSELKENQIAEAFTKGRAINVEMANKDNWRSMMANKAVSLAEAKISKDFLSGSRILKARNNAVHLAYVDESIRGLGSEFADWLRAALDVSECEFVLYREGFYSQQNVTSFLMGEAEQRCKNFFNQEVKDLIDVINNHRTSYARRLADYAKKEGDEGKARAMIKATADPQREISEDSVPAKCPVCDNDAEYHREVIGVEEEYERDGDPYIYPIYEEWFYCPWCQLDLNETQNRLLPKTGIQL